MTRTFIALEMNSDLQRHLEGVIRQVAQALPNNRWVDPTGIHLTLAFLGELSDGELGGVKHAVAAAAQQSAPFSYRLSRLGTFGSPHQPRVVWMGIEESTGALQHLHQALQRELLRRNFAVEKRPFSPHLTLARIKAPLRPEELQQLQRILDGPQKGIVSPQAYAVTHIDVMKSELARTGAKYSSLQAYQLGAQ